LEDRRRSCGFSPLERRSNLTDILKNEGKSLPDVKILRECMVFLCQCQRRKDVRYLITIFEFTTAN